MKEKIMKYIGQWWVNIFDHNNMLKSLDDHTTTKKTSPNVCIFVNKKNIKKIMTFLMKKQWCFKVFFYGGFVFYEEVNNHQNGKQSLLLNYAFVIKIKHSH